MPWRIRLIDCQRRFVIALGRARDGTTLRVRWMAFHTVPPSWADVFPRMLHLAGVELAASPSKVTLRDNGGEVVWRTGSRWTTIDLLLTKGSKRKQDLIAAAIAKAARYH